MIVITRARDEAIRIGDDILVTVIDIRGDKVRLGIDHPADVPVHRQEVYEALQRSVRERAPNPGSTPIQPPHFATAQPQASVQPEALGRFAAILEVKLGVAITRELIARALEEVGLEVVAKQPARV